PGAHREARDTVFARPSSHLAGGIAGRDNPTMPASTLPDPRRRGLLALALAAGVAPSQVACAQLREWPGDPFALGVASGCPRADSVVLWTRLAPAAAPGASEI